MSDRKREAISKTAKIYREQAAKGGHVITQTQAEARVGAAVRNTERKHR